MDERYKLIIAGPNDTKYTISHEEMFYAIRFSLALVTCLTWLEDRAELEKSRGTVRESARALTSFHGVAVAPVTPVWWYRVRYGLLDSEKPDFEVNLDEILALLPSLGKPPDERPVEIEISVHLDGPFGEESFYVPQAATRSGGRLAISRNEFSKTRVY